MILGFKEYFNNDLKRPTYFREKILAVFPIILTVNPPITIRPKLHSIRKGNRWKAGNSIQMATGVRTKRYKQFNKRIERLEKCISVQIIEIVYAEPNVHLWPMWIKVDGRSLDKVEVCHLATNDGFDSVSDFLTYFNDHFTGQIVHWTDLKY